MCVSVCIVRSGTCSNQSSNSSNLTISFMPILKKFHVSAPDGAVEGSELFLQFFGLTDRM